MTRAIGKYSPTAGGDVGCRDCGNRRRCADVLDDPVVALGADVGQSGLHPGDGGGACQFSMMRAKPIASGTFAGGTESVGALQCGMNLIVQPITIRAAVSSRTARALAADMSMTRPADKG